jgi:hypothetical protein
MITSRPLAKGTPNKDVKIARSLAMCILKNVWVVIKMNHNPTGTWSYPQHSSNSYACKIGRVSETKPLFSLPFHSPHGRPSPNAVLDALFLHWGFILMESKK